MSFKQTIKPSVLSKQRGAGRVTGVGRSPSGRSCSWDAEAFSAVWHRRGHQGLCPGEHKALPVSCRQDKQLRPGMVPLPRDYVTRGMWNSLVSKIKGLLGGLGSLLALWSSLKRPVPMFIGIPMMMHSDTPQTESFWPK